MKTNELIGLLAQDPLPSGPPPHQQIGLAVLGAAPLCGLLVLAFWGFNPDMAQMATHPAFLTKMVWLLVLAVLSAHGLMRLSRPGVAAGKTFPGLALALLAMACLGGMQSLQASPEHRLSLWMGSSWATCSVSILLVSLPLLGALLWAMRQLAPTRPVLAGTVAGAMAGCVAAGIYSFHCTETAFGFFAVWYGLGMVAAAVVGGLLGRRLLRW